MRFTDVEMAISEGTDMLTFITINKSDPGIDKGNPARQSHVAGQTGLR